jgi:Tol biopolymer transport system component
MKKGIVILFTALYYPFILSLGLTSCQKAAIEVKKTDSSISQIVTLASRPTLTGKLVYHSYDNYGDAAKMYLYNFNTNKLTWVSQHWNIFDPINAQFNFDGSQIVFMGEATQNGKWDIYLWTVGSANPPTNLTASDGCRDEDPHFSPNGYRICFKQTAASGVGNLKIMDLGGTITNNVTQNTVESGMPYYSDDATALLYARGAGSTSDIYMVNIDGSNNHALANNSNVQEYYPIVLGPSTFLYARWFSSSNQNDQVYMGYFGNNTRTRLPFNTNDADYSDPYPCASDKVILSCDKAGGSGVYDLYIANMATGAMWSLSSYNSQINTSSNELGVSYTNQ